jgi:hypothetical protein
MSVEIHDKLIKLLADVEELKQKETGTKAEKQRHLELMAIADDSVHKCDDELNDIHENQLRLRREMETLKDDLFRREDEPAPVLDETHVVTDGSAPSSESEGRKMWKEQAARLKTVK